MAELSNKDLVEGLNKAVEKSNEFLKVTEKTFEVVKKMASVISSDVKGISADTAKGIKTLNTALQESEKLTALKQKTEQEAVKTAQQLEKLEAERAKTLTQLNKAEDVAVKTAITKRKEEERRVKQSEKQAEQTKKQHEQLNSVYIQTAKRLNILRKRQKDLNTQNKLGEKLTKEQRRELVKTTRTIKRLDKALKDVDEEAGQFQRNVGNYPKTLGKASESLLKMAAAAGVVAGSLKGVETSLNSTDEGSKDVAEATATLSAGFDVAKNTAAGLFLDLKDLVTGNLSLNRAMGGLGGVFKRTSENTKNLTKDFDTLSEADAKAAVSAIAFRDELRDLNTEVAELSAETAKQTAISGDSTKSYDEIGKAAVKASESEAKRIALLIDITTREKEILDEQLKARENTDLKNNALLDAQAEKATQLVELRGELAVQQAETNKIVRENERDLFERNKDFTVDAFDTIKTVNERIIADETKTLEERQNLLNRTVELSEKSFAEQQRLSEDYVGRKLELNKLIAIDDEEEIRRRLKLAEFDDVTAGVLLEVIRERKIVLQDLAEAQIDLNEAEREQQTSETNIKFQEKEIKLLNDKLNGKIKTEEEFDKLTESHNIERLQAERDVLKEQLGLAKKGSTQSIEIQQELNDKEIELLEAKIDKQEKAAEKQKEIDEKALEDRKELIEGFTDFAIEQNNKINDKRQENARNAIEQAKDNQKAIIDGINAGSVLGEQSLALERKVQAEREAELEKLESRRLKTEAFIALMQSFGKTGDVNTALDGFTKIKSAVSSIKGYYEGADRVGMDGSEIKFSEGRDGYLARLDKDEMVLNKNQANEARRLGYGKREDILDLMRMTSLGVNVPDTRVIINNNTELINETKQVRKALEKLPQNMPIHNTVLKDDPRYIQSVIKKNNVIEKTTRRAQGTWGR